MMSDIEEVIKLVNKETEREDLSEEIKQYLFCDLRHKLWKMESERASSDRPSGAWTPCTKNGLPLTELGRREGQKWYGYKCSECNFIYKGNALIESPFCQNCGCRMKGADNE